MVFWATNFQPQIAKIDHGGPPRTPSAVTLQLFSEFLVDFFGGGGGGGRLKPSPGFRLDFILCGLRRSAHPGGVRRIFEEGKNELKIQKSRQIEAKGSNPCYFWAGPAECAGRAEALEFGKMQSYSITPVPRRGGGGFKAQARIPPGLFIEGQLGDATKPRIAEIIMNTLCECLCFC